MFGVRNGVFEAGCDVGFLSGWVVCRGVGYFPGESILWSACWKAYRALSLISCCGFCFCDSQVGNNNFLRRYMISIQSVNL